MAEQDWKLYRARFIEWRDRYVERVNRELIASLVDGGAEVTERFWNTKDRIDAEARLLHLCFDGSTRSNMIHHLLSMQAGGVIDDDDLEGFSQEVLNVMRGGDIEREEVNPYEDDDDDEFDFDDDDLPDD